MSKSLGNAITLDEYLQTYGADATRMALVSYTGLQQDFVFEDERLEFFRTFLDRLWKMGRVAEAANTYTTSSYDPNLLSAEDKQLLAEVTNLGGTVSSFVEKYFLAQAQEKLVSFLPQLETYAGNILSRDDAEHALAVFHHVFKEYIIFLHPFAPFITEELYSRIYKDSQPLAAGMMPAKKN